MHIHHLSLFIRYRSDPAMPSLLIQTNAPLGAAAKTAVMQQASRVVSEQTGKPESFVLVSLRECDMLFGGTADPCAYMVCVV